jgi:putative heme iron utilization protein
MNDGAAARRYLRHHWHGALSTNSQRLAGYPFGSIVPCVTDHAARPVILVSRLAEHTKNMLADQRVSLLVRDDSADPQESARLTMIGDAKPAHDADEAVQARYLRYFPGAARLLALGDFSFFHIEPVTLRYIGGFGAIHWISAINFAPPANALAACEADIIAHMNADHLGALYECCRHFNHAQPSALAMIGIDCDGVDVRADDRILRFDFAEPISDAPGARAALKALVAAARQ